MDPVQSTHLPGTASADAGASQAEAKAKKAGADFEAILLNNVLGGLEHAFTNLPGKKEGHSTEAYGGFAMQALASGLADSGGIGVGRLIGKAINRRSEQAQKK